MATKKTKVESTGTTLEGTSHGACPTCVLGRIPQSREWHYVSCPDCKGTGMK